MTEDQIRHLEEHRVDFVSIFDRSVRVYAEEYSYIDGLYENLCSDLGINPKY